MLLALECPASQKLAGSHPTEHEHDQLQKLVHPRLLRHVFHGLYFKKRRPTGEWISQPVSTAPLQNSMYLLPAFFILSIYTSALGQSPPQALTVSVAYDEFYDNPSSSLTQVACSQFANDFPTLGTLPCFPRVGAAFAVKGFGSPGCGTCWDLTFTHQPPQTPGTTSIQVLAIDQASEGFVLSKAAMDALTGGRATQLGRVSVTAIQVTPNICGFS